MSWCCVLCKEWCGKSFLDEHYKNLRVFFFFFLHPATKNNVIQLGKEQRSTSEGTFFPIVLHTINIPIYHSTRLDNSSYYVSVSSLVYALVIAIHFYFINY